MTIVVKILIIYFDKIKLIELNIIIKLLFISDLS